MSALMRELQTQPPLWRRAAVLGKQFQTTLSPAEGRVAVIGCGTSWFMAQSYAGLRETRTGAPTDAYPASEAEFGRGYDRVLAISRSGMTTEVERALSAAAAAGIKTVVVTAVRDSILAELADEAVVLEFADEVSIVQTRFATSALALLRAAVGDSIEGAVADAEAALQTPLPLVPTQFERFVFLGSGWTVGIANEAALKLREAAGAWTESYPAMEYRHGPLSVPARTVVWTFAPVPDDLLAAIVETGATVVVGALDAMAELVLVQRTALALAHARGSDPDNPPFLSRAIVLA